MTTKSKTVKIANGRDIYYEEAGKGEAVIMLHGGGPGASGMSNFSKNVEVLAKNFRVIVPDLPGYGQSSKGLDKSDVFGDLASSIIQLMDKMKLKKASLVGNSLGGGAALRAALDYPERVNRLVLMGPGGIRSSKAPPTKGLKALLNYYKGEGPRREKLATFLREFLVADGSMVSDKMIDERYQSSLDPEVIADPPLGIKGLGAFFRMDLARDKRLPRLPHPTLVLWGADDKVNRPSGGEWLQRNMQHCDHYVFADTGHWVQWERAAEFNAVCGAFLADK